MSVLPKVQRSHIEICCLAHFFFFFLHNRLCSSPKKKNCMFSFLFTASDKSVWFLASRFIVPAIPANIRPLRHHKGEIQKYYLTLFRKRFNQNKNKSIKYRLNSKLDLNFRTVVVNLERRRRK